jgi:hypothetical protein
MSPSSKKEKREKDNPDKKLRIYSRQRKEMVITEEIHD